MLGVVESAGEHDVELIQGDLPVVIGASSAGAAHLAAAEVRLWVNRHTTRALNFYASKPFAFSPEDQDVAHIYATHASSALAASHRISGLKTALNTRHQIGVAQGIVMNRYGLSLEGSFEVLRRYSSHTNTK